MNLSNGSSPINYDTEGDSLPLSCAFQTELRRLCLNEFPCGVGSWTERGRSKRNVDAVLRQFSVTLRDYGTKHYQTEMLKDLIAMKKSPWNANYDWSDEAESLREIAVQSPWIIDDQFVWGYFRSLKIVDKGVTVVDENMTRLENLIELTLSANRLTHVDSRNLPRNLKVLELCANEIMDAVDLCYQPPVLQHLGLGYNRLTSILDSIHGPYWPELLSLDLSHNNLVYLSDTMRALVTLPKLRNLMLHGNPLALVPAYRGYTIEYLKKLDYLDDSVISIDERLQYAGLGEKTDCELREARVVFKVPFLRGIPIPDEIENPDEQPEFPRISRKYYVQFLFPLEGPSQNNPPGLTENGTVPQRLSLTSALTTMALDATAKNASNVTELTGDLNAVVDPMLTLTLDREVAKVALVRSADSEWIEDDMALDWTRVIPCRDLLTLRDFMRGGLDIAVVEEKIESNPAPPPEEEEESGEGAVPRPSQANKKPAKQEKKTPKKIVPPPKQSKDAGKKKGKIVEVDVPMIQSPPEYTTLAEFHVHLEQIFDGVYSFEQVFSKEMEQKKPRLSTDLAVAAKKKAPDPKKKGGKDAKRKSKTGEIEEEAGTVSLEISFGARLVHWNTFHDSLQNDV